MKHEKPVVAADIEVYRNYFLAGFKRRSDGMLLQFELSDRTNTFDKERIKRILLNHTCITFNGLGYDMPLLWAALNGATPSQLKDWSDSIIQGRIRPWDVEKLTGVRVPREMTHIDLIEPQPNAIASLKTLNGRLHGRKMQDLPIEPEAVMTFEEMQETTDYNENDLDATLDLYDALIPALELRRRLGEQYGMDFMSKSDAQIGEAIIKSLVEKETGQRAEKVKTPAGHSFPFKAPEWLRFEHPEMQEVMTRLAATQFIVKHDGKVDLPPFLHNRKVTIGSTEYAMGIGGLHSTEKERAVVADDDCFLEDYDVTSYYPYIIIGSGLYPRALGPEFLRVFLRIIETRRDAKAIAKGLEKKRRKEGSLTPAEELEYETAKTTEAGLKIALNGCYGKLGSPYSILYAPHLMIAVTLTGQLALLMLIERAEAAGIKVVSANTDGVVFQCPHELKDRLAEVTAQWERDTTFSLESTGYAGLYNMSVNAYIAVGTDGKVKRKGTLANPGFETPPDMRTQMMTSPSMNICSDAVVAYLTKGTPLEETIEGCTDIRQFVTVVNVQGGGTWRGKYLGKVVRYAWSKDGAEILYKKPHPTTGNFKKVPKTDGSRPVMNLPDEFPIDIDHARYVAEAREILMKIGADRRPPPPVKVRVYAKDRLQWLRLAIAG